jgi:hypothetical protein
MSKYPVRLAERALRNVEKDAVEVNGSTSMATPFFTFRYTYTEISALGGKAHVKAKKARFENRKLTSETFEGELDRSAYEQMASQAQHYFLSQAALLLQPLSWFLPSSRNHSTNRD